MALFPRDDVLPEEEATRRRSVTREVGTRKLVIAFVALVAVWFVGSRIWDLFLLRQSWPPLGREVSGLSVVSTLDQRGSYDRNLFRIVLSEGEARAEITNYGWESIFGGKHGKLSDEGVGRLIRAAIDLDSETGYAMLTPFLAAEVRMEMGDYNAYNMLSGEYGVDTQLPMTDEEKKDKHIRPRRKSLQELLDYFAEEGRGGKNGDSHESSEGGSGTGQKVEHGLVVPGEILVQTCPVVLMTQHFSHGWVEEHPVDVMGGRTYSVWLDLTPEGRSRFYQWSRNHANEHLLFVLDHAVVANGRIAMTMNVDKWEITNLKDVVAAKRLVDYINSHQVSGR